MRQAMLIAVGLLCMAKGTAWGYASFTDGNDLQRLCNSNSAGDRQACSYYIRGAFDMLSSLGNLSDRICVSRCAAWSVERRCGTLASRPPRKMALDCGLYR